MFSSRLSSRQSFFLIKQSQQSTCFLKTISVNRVFLASISRVQFNYHHMHVLYTSCTDTLHPQDIILWQTNNAFGLSLCLMVTTKEHVLQIELARVFILTQPALCGIRTQGWKKLVRWWLMCLNLPPCNYTHRLILLNKYTHSPWFTFCIWRKLKYELHNSSGKQQNKALVPQLVKICPRWCNDLMPLFVNIWKFCIASIFWSACLKRIIVLEVATVCVMIQEENTFDQSTLRLRIKTFLSSHSAESCKC